MEWTPQTRPPFLIDGGLAHSRRRIESCAEHDSRPRARGQVHVRACDTSFFPANEVNGIGCGGLTPM
jgi:hypothetical protein